MTKINIVLFNLCALVVLLSSIWLNELVSIYIYILILPFLTLIFPLNISSKIQFLGVFVYAICVLIYMQITPTLAGPDAHDYFAQLLRFDGIGEYISYLGYLYTIDPTSLRSAELAFPFLLKIFYSLFNLELPQSIILINVTFWIIAVFVFVSLYKKTHLLKNKNYINILLFLLLLSPSGIYWSVVFNKDVAVVGLCLITVYLINKKGYLAAFIITILATYIRPYSVAIIGIYWLFLFANRRMIILSLVSSFLILILYTTSVNAIINLPLLLLFLFFSPSPADITNWSGFIDTGTWEVYITPLTIEGLIVGVSMLFSLLVAIRSKKYLKVIARYASVIFIYAIVLIMVGYTNLEGKGIQYEIGVLGDNMVRKKLPVIPLILGLMVYNIQYLLSFITRK